MKGAVEMSSYYLCSLGFPFIAPAFTQGAPLSLLGDCGAPEASLTSSRSLPFIGMTLPWGPLTEGFQVREV